MEGKSSNNQKRINTVKRPVKKRRDFLWIEGFIILAALISTLILGAALRFHDDSEADIMMETVGERTIKAYEEKTDTETGTNNSSKDDETVTKKVPKERTIVTPGEKRKKKKDPEQPTTEQPVWVNTHDFNLFSKEYFNGSGAKTVHSENDSDKLIAPGTESTVTINLKDPNSYGTEYKMYFKANISNEDASYNLPIKIGIGVAGTSFSANEDIHNYITSDANGILIDSGHLNTNEVKNFELKWKWDYEHGNDEGDLAQTLHNTNLNCSLKVISEVDDQKHDGGDEEEDTDPTVRKVTDLVDQVSKIKVPDGEDAFTKLKASGLKKVLVEPYIINNLKSVGHIGLFGLIVAVSAGIYMGFHKKRIRRFNKRIDRRIKRSGLDNDNQDNK